MTEQIIPLLNLLLTVGTENNVLKIHLFLFCIAYSQPINNLVPVVFSDENFVTAVAALPDLYCVIAKYSEKLQDLQALPWDRTRAFDDLAEYLEQLQANIPVLESIPENNVADDSSRWKVLSTRPVTQGQVGYVIGIGHFMKFLSLQNEIKHCLILCRGKIVNR